MQRRKFNFRIDVCAIEVVEGSKMKRFLIAAIFLLASVCAIAQTITAGLPPGIKLSAAGQLQGIPVASGTFQFAIQVQDSSQHTTSKTFSLTISPSGGGLTITTPAQLPPGTQNVLYSQTLQATGGTGTLTWSMLSSPAVQQPIFVPMLPGYVLQRPLQAQK